MKSMKIPQILVNPPDWLAVLISAALGLLYVFLLIVGKNLVHLIP